MISALRGKTTVFFSTHILADVERVCDEVAIVDRGRLIVQDTVTGLKARYGGSVKYLLNTGDDQERVLPLLQQESWLINAQPTPTGLELGVSDLAAAQRRVPAVVSDLGARIVSFEPKETSLEDVFVSLVEETA